MDLPPAFVIRFGHRDVSMAHEICHAFKSMTFVEEHADHCRPCRVDSDIATDSDFSGVALDAVIQRFRIEGVIHIIFRAP